MTEEQRQHLEAMREIWQNAQKQVAEEKARNGTTDPATPKRTAAHLSAIQAHVNHLWEEGERLRGVYPGAEIACDTCKGARWLRNGRGSIGSTVPCPSCWFQWYAEKIRRRWRLQPKERYISRKPFQKRLDAPQMTGVYRTVKAFGRKVIAGKADLLAITGSYGIGKSHLMLILYQQVDLANRPVIYRTASQLRDLLQSFGTRSEEERTIAKNDMLRVSLLIIDEAEKAWHTPRDENGKGEWFNSQMLDILNARRNAGLATAIAGNDLFELPGPVLSRIQERGCDFLNIKGVPDARPLLGGETEEVAL